MRCLSRAMLVAVLVAASTEAVAQPHLIGLAGQSCETWITNRPASGGALGVLYQQWIFGFLSGVSYADPDHDPLKGVDAMAITTWVDEYCAFRSIVITDSVPS